MNTAVIEVFELCGLVNLKLDYFLCLVPDTSSSTITTTTEGNFHLSPLHAHLAFGIFIKFELELEFIANN